MLNLALTSSSLHYLSLRFIYRSIAFVFSEKRSETNQKLIRRLIAGDTLASTVREIRILWAPSVKLEHGEGSKQDLELLGEALPRFTALKTFVWDAQYEILPWLRVTLQTHHPHCNLYLRSYGTYPGSAIGQQVKVSPCLFSSHYIGFQICPLSHFLDSMCAARNLKDINVTWPSLRPVHFTNLPAKRRQSGLLKLRSFSYDGHFSVAIDDRTAWEMIDFSSLERLSLNMLEPLFIFSSQLDNLKILRLHMSDGLPLQIGEDEDSRLRTFLNMWQNFRQLESLDMTGCIATLNEEYFQDIWKHVARTLTSLRLHEPESRLGSQRRPILSRKVINIIAQHCRRLRSLGVDLECASMKPVGLD